jgi:hypothetical protein
MSARERQQGPPPGTVRGLVELVHDRAAATWLVAFHGSAEDAIEAAVRDRRP